MELNVGGAAFSRSSLLSLAALKMNGNIFDTHGTVLPLCEFTPELLGTHHVHCRPDRAPHYGWHFRSGKRDSRR
jgi:hypothetical protein